MGNGITSIGTTAFMGCSSLVSLTVSDSMTTIGPGSFVNSGLTTVYMKSSTASSLGVSFGSNKVFGDKGGVTIIQIQLKLYKSKYNLH